MAEMGVAEPVRRTSPATRPHTLLTSYTHSGPVARERRMELVADFGNYGKTRQRPFRRPLPRSRKPLRPKRKLVAGGRLELPTLGL